MFSYQSLLPFNFPQLDLITTKILKLFKLFPEKGKLFPLKNFILRSKEGRKRWKRKKLSTSYFSLLFSFFTDTENAVENVWPSRVSLSALLFVLIFYFRHDFRQNFSFVRIKNLYFFCEARRWVLWKFRSLWCLNFRNYTEMKMFPSPLRNFGARFSGVGDSSKAERQGERQSTIKRAPLDEGGRGSEGENTHRSTYKHNKSFFSRGLPGECNWKGVAELCCVLIPWVFASVFISIFWSVDGKPLEFLWLNAKFSFEFSQDFGLKT